MSSLSARLQAAAGRLRWELRRQISEFRRWLENTRNFVHISLLLVLPLVIAFVTVLSNRADFLPFLLFPPLASGGYTLFANPESRYASPRRFVGGMTVGAVCGWLALVLTGQWYQIPDQIFWVHPWAAAFGVLLTGLVTWLFDLEGSQAFSTALLVLVVGVTQLVYVLSVFVSSALVAGVFVFWRRELYERRADYLYQTTHGDDHVLVPMRGDTANTVASFGAQLAAPHDASKVVLLEIIDTDEPGPEDAAAPDGGANVSPAPSTGPGETPDRARATADRLEQQAAALSEQYDVPCEFAVVTGDPDDAQTVVQTAQEMNCDLVVTPYDQEDGSASQFVKALFASRIDVVALWANGSRDEWRRILAPIKYDGDVAHAILDFAGRLAGERGHASVCHCIDSERERRTGEELVADLAEPFERAFETRVTTAPLSTFLAENAGNYDLTILGSSTDRTLLSRLLDPPTFEQLDGLECDVAIVHRGDPSGGPVGGTQGD